MRAWLMPDAVTNQRDECRLDPNVDVSPEELAAIGVYYEYIDPTNALEGLNRVSKERNYASRDEITVAKDKLPNYEDKIKIFFDEHIHVDEEIRYVKGGSGYFDVRDGKDRWVRIEVVPGDLIVLPAGIYHRFTVDQKQRFQDFINAIRLFKENPKWEAINRGQQAEATPERQQYLQTIAV